MKSTFVASTIGKAVSKVSRLKGGHGSALPGLVVEKIYPDFLCRVLGDLPQGVVVISGTNGKTTTTKIVVELLRAEGLKVFTNPSGSNFTRGVASSAISEMKRGKLDADIAILELDEAHAVHFVNKVTPKHALILNVLRDQLDRFGEIDKTAQLLSRVVSRATGVTVLNREDPLVSEIPAKSKVYFGYSKKVSKIFPNDNEMYGGGTLGNQSSREALVTLDDLSGNIAKFNIGESELKLRGAHNALNAAAALALTRVIIGDKFNAKRSLSILSEIQPAFGRGESLVINNTNVELILVKNPSGFRISLKSQNYSSADTMIAINDLYADGRDMSWLWDVDFSELNRVDVVSGDRAYDMALRLVSGGIPVGSIDTNLESALDNFLSLNPGNSKQIYTTYTAMLKLRRLIKLRMRAKN